MLLEISFTVSAPDAEHLTDVLLEHGALSASVEDAQALAPDEQPIFGEPGTAQDMQAWPESKIVALLPLDTDVKAWWAELLANEPLLGKDTALTIRSLEDKDWVSETQRQFEPFAVGTQLWIGAGWHEPPAAVPADRVIRLDPGMAFGTGSHATTQLCLEAIAQLCDQLGHGKGSGEPAERFRVLDYGCGSGILALAAAKLMPTAEVVALDIDPIACETARENARRNQVKIQVLDAEAADAQSMALLAQPSDLVLANILAQPLKVLAPALCRYVRPGGALVLSGILARQAEEILAAYAEHAQLAVLAERDGWVAIGTLGL